jgi:hypothetical protein
LNFWPLLPHHGQSLAGISFTVLQRKLANIRQYFAIILTVSAKKAWSNLTQTYILSKEHAPLYSEAIMHTQENKT